MAPTRQRHKPGLLSSQGGERKAKTGKGKAKAGEFKLVVRKALKEFERRSSKNKTILTKRINLRSAEQILQPFIVKREVPVFVPSKKKRINLRSAGSSKKKRYNLRSAEKFSKPLKVKREVPVFVPSKKKRCFFSIKKANKVLTKHDLSYTKKQKKDYQSSLVLPVAPEEPVDPEEPVALPAASKKLEQKAAHERGSHNRNSGPRNPTFFNYDHSLSEYVTSSIYCFNLNQSVSGPVTVLPFIGMEVGRF